ncbi:MAG: hypothetical protein BWK80_38010, partial [Desulfobacteraceae bacterium IS3]
MLNLYIKIHTGISPPPQFRNSGKTLSILYAGSSFLPENRTGRRPAFFIPEHIVRTLIFGIKEIIG